MSIGAGFMPRKIINMVVNEEQLSKMSKILSGEKMLSLDVETTIYEKPPRICTIQLSTKNQNWIIDALKCNWMEHISKVLEDESIIKVIHNASFEKGMFMLYGIRINNIFDTMIMSRKLRGMRLEGGHNLKNVCLRELNLELDKSSQTSDWTKRPLSKKQLMYAALDSEVLIDLYEKFSKCLDKTDEN